MQPCPCHLGLSVTVISIASTFLPSCRHPPPLPPVIHGWRVAVLLCKRVRVILEMGSTLGGPYGYGAARGRGPGWCPEVAGRASLPCSWDGQQDPLLWFGPESRDRSQSSGVTEQPSLLQWGVGGGGPRSSQVCSGGSKPHFTWVLLVSRG